MPSDKEQATAAAAATASTRPKAAAVAAAADSSKPSPNAPSTSSAAASTTRPSAASGPSGSRSSGSSSQTQPVVLNTLRDPSHYEELNVIGNGEMRLFRSCFVVARMRCKPLKRGRRQSRRKEVPVWARCLFLVTSR